MDKGICEHILLILAAILSDINLQHEFERLNATIQPFVNSSDVKYEWVDDVSTSNICYKYSLQTLAVNMTY